MATERKPLPQLAKTAMQMLQREYDARADAIGKQAVEAMGLDPAEDWVADFAAGEVRRDVPDAETPN